MFYGNPVSQGIAIAKAYHYEPLSFQIEKRCFTAGKEAEMYESFECACKTAKEELDNIYESLAKEEEEKAKIFLAHMEILEDEEILEEIQQKIRKERIVPEAAIAEVFDFYAGMIAKVQDSLIAGRAVDICDVKNRLLRIYQGKQEQNLSNLTEDVVVIAHDLLPSDTATLDRKHVKAILTEVGGSNSHSAILARSYQIPAILGVEHAMEQIRDGSLLAVDALNGEIFVEPDAKTIELMEQKAIEFQGKRRLEEQYLQKPALLKDGTKIEIGINIGAADYEAEALSYDFIGLFRTEFLYMEGVKLPSEEEQFQVYRKILQQANGKVVTLRTLDIGGDKTLPYMELPKEDNPFLGKRALRLCFANPEIFKTQLRAALRASAYGKLQIMFPMVGRIEDITKANEIVANVKKELDEKGISYDNEIKIGIMIEIPSIGIIADLAAEEADFASIGSNDLTQYICAADRMNPELTEYYENYSPAMVRILGYIIEQFRSKEKQVSICGEMAGNPKAAVLLVGLGVKKLSMSAASIAAVKAELAGITLEQAKNMAAECKKLKTEKEIRQYLGM